VASFWSNAFFDDAWSNAVTPRLEAQRQGRELTDDDIEVITRIARNRAELILNVRNALEAGHHALLKLVRQYGRAEQVQALKLMYQVCGLEQPQ
jgi:hypothetical protein